MPKYQLKPKIVEAEQFTEEIALDCLCEKKPGPFGLIVSGSCNPDERKLYHAHGRLRLKDGRFISVCLHQWIVRDQNDFYEFMFPESFSEKYELAPKRKTKEKICPECHGKKYIETAFGGDYVCGECDECHGTGFIN